MDKAVADKARADGPHAPAQTKPAEKPASRPAAKAKRASATREAATRGGKAESPKKRSAARGAAKKPARRPAAKAAAAWETFEAEATDRPVKAPATTSDAPAAPSPGESERVVVVTGIVGRLGQLLARRLHRTDRVIGIDRRDFPGRPKDIVHHQVDIRRKKTRDVFRSERVDAVVHLGVLHDPRASARDRHKWNVVAFQKLLEYVAEYDVQKLVVLSSANVYGPQPDNPQFLTEEAPLLGSQAFGGMRDLVELDMLAQSFFWKHPSTETVILRPVHILGGVRNAPSNYLRLERPMTLLGFDPMVQVIHERDVVDALAKALAPGVRGIFNLRGPGELPLSKILRLLGRRPRALPSFAAKAAVERMWKLRLASFPAPELDFIRYVCMVDDTRAREVLGHRPRFDLERTVRSVLSER